MVVNKKYLVFPINTKGEKVLVNFYLGNERVRYFNMRLDNENCDYKAYIDMSEFLSKDIKIEAENGYQINIEESDVYKDETLYKEELRPKVHFSTRQGWINDPNGLVFDGENYHLFYQHNPCDHQWENMSWGHAVSPDLIHWEEKDIALYPDEFGTMFSGSAIIDEKNLLGKQVGNKKTILLYYTAAAQKHTEHKNFTQCLAYSTDGGKTFVKYENNPVIDFIKGENRDPKIVWCPELNCYLLALFLDGFEYAIFKTDNLVNFTEWFRFTAPEENECPDIFRLKADDGKYKWVFIGAHDVYVIGEIKDNKFIPDTGFKKLHNGAWYASQTYSGLSNSRRVRVEWMRWFGLDAKTFNQQMGIPTEITLKNINGEYYLSAEPVKELEGIYQNTEVFENIEVKNGEEYVIKKDAAPVYIEIKGEYPEKGKLKVNSFGMRAEFDFLGNKAKITEFENQISLNKEKLDIKILIDKTSCEIFMDGGVFCLTNAGRDHLIIDDKQSEIKFTCDADIKLSKIKVTDLKNIWSV